MTLEVKATPVASPLFSPVAQKLCRCEYGVYSRAERVFIQEQCFPSKSLEAFSNSYPDKEVLSKIRTHRQVTTLWVDACLREGGGNFQHLL
jgi:hypothetical protein